MNPNNRQLKRIGPVADAFVRSRAFIQGIMGPVGSGKTIASGQKMLLLAARQRGVRDRSGCIIRKSRFAVIRDTYPNLDRNTIPSWHKVVPKDRGTWNGGSPRLHRFSMTLGKDEHGNANDVANVEVEFRAIGDASVEDALRGLEVTAAFVNEADRTHPDILTFLAGRVGRFGDLDAGMVVDPQIILDLNGNDDENWTYKVLIEEVLSEELAQLISDVSGGRPLIEYFEQPEAVDENGKLNPDAENVANLPEGYYARQYALAKMRGDHNYINRMLRSRYVPLRFGLPVFPEYRDNIHAAEFDAIPGIPLFIMADQGLLGAALVGQVVKGQLCILEEYSRVFETDDDEIIVSQMGGEAFGELIREDLAVRYAGYRIADAVCDPAGAAGEEAINYQSWRQDFQKGLGHKVRKARVPGNALEPRLKAVRRFLGAPVGEQRKLLIHKRCKMTRRAFMTKYYYSRTSSRQGDGSYAEVPQKVQGYGDLMDAVQYGCFELDKGLDLTPEAARRIGAGVPRVTVNSHYDPFGAR
jgi:hypothetical protein